MLSQDEIKNTCELSRANSTSRRTPFFTNEEFFKMQKIGYRFIGPSRHSAVKICTWCRHAIRGDKRQHATSENFCYKQKFYGIESHRCIQMSPAVPFCTHNCEFCWRIRGSANPKWQGPIDDPKVILDEAIESHKELLKGFGAKWHDKKRYEEAMNPKHVAISLDGEPLMYPRIVELVREIKQRGMTAFLVTNGTLPDVLEKLIDEQPTQLYITLPAPNEEIYRKTCKADNWKEIMRSLSLLGKFSCPTVVRLTLAKGVNFVNPEEYAEIIKKHSPRFVEVKSAMSVGGARQRIPYENMPLHPEIAEFSTRIANESGYRIVNEKKESRVVLLERN